MVTLESAKILLGEQPAPDQGAYRRRSAKKNDTELRVEILHFAYEFPELGPKNVAKELTRSGKPVVASTVYSIWSQEGLQTFDKRMAARQQTEIREQPATTDRRLVLRKYEDWICKKGLIKADFPGHIGTQDTHCAGIFNGLGKVYMQVFIDVYSTFTMAKLYDERSILTPSDMLALKVLPFFIDNQRPLHNILTDRGIEFCGAIKNHPYQMLLMQFQINHIKVQTRDPQINALCNKFNLMIHRDLLGRVSTEKPYKHLEQLQNEVDRWVEHYNYARLIEEGCFKDFTPYKVFTRTQNH